VNSVHNGHAPGVDTSLLSVLQGLANTMDTDTAILMAAATHIRAGISTLRKSSRNPIHQQTREEWLRAYDEADVMSRPKTRGAL
jgi:hypothetical protein